MVEIEGRRMGAKNAHRQGFIRVSESFDGHHREVPPRAGAALFDLRTGAFVIGDDGQR